MFSIRVRCVRLRALRESPKLCARLSTAAMPVTMDCWREWPESLVLVVLLQPRRLRDETMLFPATVSQKTVRHQAGRVRTVSPKPEEVPLPGGRWICCHMGGSKVWRRFFESEAAAERSCGCVMAVTCSRIASNRCKSGKSPKGRRALHQVSHTAAAFAARMADGSVPRRAHVSLSVGLMRRPCCHSRRPSNADSARCADVAAITGHVTRV